MMPINTVENFLSPLGKNPSKSIRKRVVSLKEKVCSLYILFHGAPMDWATIFYQDGVLHLDKLSNRVVVTWCYEISLADAEVFYDVFKLAPWKIKLFHFLPWFRYRLWITLAKGNRGPVESHCRLGQRKPKIEIKHSEFMLWWFLTRMGDRYKKIGS